MQCVLRAELSAVIFASAEGYSCCGVAGNLRNLELNADGVKSCICYQIMM